MNQEDEKEELLKKQFFLTHLQSAQDLKQWVMTYLGIDLPYSTTDSESNSSPVDAMWEIYEAIKLNKGDDIPGYIMLSAREGYKTLSASILEILILSHFQLSIAHMAAIRSQSNKAISYIQSFLIKLKRYYDHAGWVQIGDSKNKIQFQTPEGNSPYITVIICSLTGANCIAGDSIIELENGKTIRAAEVSSGLKIKTWDYKNQQDTYVTSKGISLTKKHARKLVLSNGSEIILSDDHLIFSQNGWVFADSVRIGDRLKTNEIVSKSFAIKQDHHTDRSLEQVILGTLLGDASIQKLPSGNCRYRVFHSKKQLSYLEMIEKVFLKNKIKCSIIPDADGYSLYTQIHPIFTPYRELFYLNDKKIVTQQILSKLTLEGIAYWFMDDVRGNSQEVGKRKDRCFELAICGFDEQSKKECLNFFKDFSPKLVKIGNSSKKQWDILKFPLKESRKLSEAISPFFIPDLRYKLLMPISRVGKGLTVDSGDFFVANQPKNGFSYSKKNNQTRLERKLFKQVKNSLNAEVVKIELLGLQELVDLHIDNEDPLLRSFYANGIFVHNSEHVPIMFLDEVDVVRDPQAYDEARAIPGMERGVYPITVKLSTRKFAFGMMQRELENAKETGELIKRWNIIDVTERCPESRHEPNPGGEKKDEIWVRDRLPLKTAALSEEDYQALPDAQKSEWQKIKVHPGCLKCPLVSVCKGRLADKPAHAISSKTSLYKPIKATIKNFNRLPPDMGEAQLMCWRPSTKGLIYPRFEPNQNGNVVSLDKAWEILTGDKKENVTMTEFVMKLHELDSNVYAGLDWGYTHESTIVIVAVTASGYSFVLDTYASPGLEPHDFAEIALTYQTKYGIYKWFCDQAAPANIKTFKKKGMRCPDFKKDVLAGIEALRSQIITSAGVRKFLVVDTPENQKLIQGFKVHHFKLDMAGNPTTTPDDEEYADVMDALRYFAQNVFNVPNSKPVIGVNVKPTEAIHRAAASNPLDTQVSNQVNTELMKQEVQKRVDTPTAKPDDDNNKKKRVFWDMS
jgi:hypothetical protein